MSSPPDAPLTVIDPRAAAFLVDPSCRRFLDPFLDRDCTVAAAARELGESPNSVLYRVRRMIDLGLLTVVREEARRGRSMRVYRSVAPRMFIPYQAVPAADLLEILLRERLLNEEILQRALLRVMRQVQAEEGWGLLLYRQNDGVYGYDAVRPDEPWHPLKPQDPAVLDYTLVLRPLSHSQAKALQLDLLDVLRRHSVPTTEPPGASAKPYLVRLALAPLASKEQGG